MVNPFTSLELFYFKHFQERGDCPIKTKGKLTQDDIDRIRYNGVRESEEHIRLKQAIFELLKADERCTDIRSEVIRRSEISPGEWRKPDVSCRFNGTKLVFEIQLSTTYLNVIVDRERHYHEDSTFVIWIFNTFDTVKQRFVHKDIYYSNKGNAFSLDAEALDRSRKAHRLILHCYRKKAIINDGDPEWIDSFVGLDQLTYNPHNFKAYFWDIERDNLREEFQSYWINSRDWSWSAREPQETAFSKRFSDMGIHYVYDYHLERMLNALYSVKLQRLVAHKFKANPFVSLAHLMLDKEERFCYLFLWSLKVYGMSERILADDRTGRLRTRIGKFKELLKDSAYQRDKTFDDLLLFLFPELIAAIPKPDK